MFSLLIVLLLVANPPQGQPGGVPAQPGASSFEALSKQAQTARDAKRLGPALDLYLAALKLRPEWDEGWWNAGSISYDLDRYPECIASFRHLVALKPKLAPAWTMLGLCQYRAKEYPDAFKSLLGVEHLGFEGPVELSRAARLHLALLLIKNGSFERAIVLLNRLTQLDRKTPEIVMAAGIAGLRRAWLPQEVPVADREMVLKLGDAMATAMERDPQGALERFEAVVREYPSVPNVHFRFGAYLMSQDADRGIAEIKKELELNPAHVPALLGLAMISLKRGDPKSAKEYATAAVKVDPKDFGTHVALGRALLGLDDLQGAVRELEVAVKLNPEEPEAHFSLASAYTRLGRRADAGRERSEFLRLRKQVETAEQ